MATNMQKRAFVELVENGRKKGDAMVRAGYSKNTAIAPTKLTDSKGFQELMEQAGLTDDFLNNALQYDIQHKKKNRKPELELAYKLKGRLTEKTDITSGGEKINKIEYILPIINKKDGDIDDKANPQTAPRLRSPEKP